MLCPHSSAPAGSSNFYPKDPSYQVVSKVVLMQAASLEVNSKAAASLFRPRVEPPHLDSASNARPASTVCSSVHPNYAWFDLVKKNCGMVGVLQEYLNVLNVYYLLCLPPSILL